MQRNTHTHETHSAFAKANDLDCCSSFLHLLSLTVWHLMPTSSISLDGPMVFAGFFFCFVNFAPVALEDLHPALASLAFSESKFKLLRLPDVLLIWTQNQPCGLHETFFHWVRPRCNFVVLCPDWLAKNLQCENRGQPLGGDWTNVLPVTFHADQSESN